MRSGVLAESKDSPVSRNQIVGVTFHACLKKAVVWAVFKDKKLLRWMDVSGKSAERLYVRLHLGYLPLNRAQMLRTSHHVCQLGDELL